MTAHTNGTAQPSAALTLDAIMEMLEQIPPKPYAEFMKSQGFSPETHILVLPASLKPEGVPVPDYVRFSPYAPGDTGYFLRREDVFLPEFDPKRGVE